MHAFKFQDTRSITYRDISTLNNALTFGTPCMLAKLELAPVISPVTVADKAKSDEFVFDLTLT